MTRRTPRRPPPASAPARRPRGSGGAARGARAGDEALLRGARADRCAAAFFGAAFFLGAAFFGADKQAQDLAQSRLKTNPDDPNAFVLPDLISEFTEIDLNQSLGDEEKEKQKGEKQQLCDTQAEDGKKRLVDASRRR